MKIGIGPRPIRAAGLCHTAPRPRGAGARRALQAGAPHADGTAAVR